MDVCYSVKVEIKFHLEYKLHFPCAQLMLRQVELTYLEVSRLSIEFIIHFSLKVLGECTF